MLQETAKRVMPRWRCFWVEYRPRAREGDAKMGLFWGGGEYSKLLIIGYVENREIVGC